MPHSAEDAVISLNLHSLNRAYDYCSPFYTAAVLLDGRISVLEAGNTHSASGAGLFLLPCGTRVRFIPEPSGSAVLLVLELHPFYAAESEQRGILLTRVLTSAEYPALQGAASPLRELAVLRGGNGTPSPLSVRRCLITFLEEISRAAPIHADSAAEAGPAAVPDRLRDIREYLMKNPGHSANLQETARAIGVTPQYLSSYFRKKEGCTFLDYASRLKAASAGAWFGASLCGAEETAGLFGFRTVPAFEKSIRIVFGCGWDEYRAGMAVPRVPLPASTVRSDIFSLIEMEKAPSPDPPSPNTLPVRFGHSVSPVQADVSSPAGTRSDSWNMIINLGPFYALASERVRSQIAEARKIAGFKYVRIYQFLDLVTTYELNGNIHFDFGICFWSIDYLRSLGYLIFADLGYTDYRPALGIVNNYYLESDADISTYYRKELEILPKFLRAACNRYGRSTVGSWIFELHFSFTRDREFTFHQFLQCYRRFEKVIHDCVPGCRFGGCGFATSLSETTFRSVFDMLEAEQVRMDFLSFHGNAITSEKARNEEKLVLARDPDILERRLHAALRIAGLYYPSLPVYLTEFGFAHYMEHYLNDSVFQCAFILRFLNSCEDRVRGIGYHILSDLPTLLGRQVTMFFGASGLFNTSSLLKPAGYAYSLKALMGQTLLSRGDDYCVTCRSRYNFQVLIFDCVSIPQKLAEDGSVESVMAFERSFSGTHGRREKAFRIRGAIPGVYLVKTYRVSPDHGNILALWSEQARNILTVSGRELRFFEHVSYPATAVTSHTVGPDGVIDITAETGPLECLMILIDYSSPSQE